MKRNEKIYHKKLKQKIFDFYKSIVYKSLSIINYLTL